MIKAPKKLIEVALPLDDINAGAAYEKLPGIGPHPRGIHHWWARRPFAAARAILFAQLVNDPGGERGWGNYPGQTKEDAQKEREELFETLRDLADWKQSGNKELLQKAQDIIKKSWRETCEMNKGVEGFDPDKLPAFHDPFAGGGAIPFEAQRLGLEAYASDLNPVAVMINKALIEIPKFFAGKAPVGEEPPSKTKSKKVLQDWSELKGIAEDVRRYGTWLRKEALKQVGDLYPRVKVTADMVKSRPDLKGYLGQELKVIAWIWARTIKSPNPAFSHLESPLISNFVLCSKKGKNTWIAPVVSGETYEIKIKKGEAPKEAKKGTKQGRGTNFQCIYSGTPIPAKYVREQAQSGRLGKKLIAIVAEGSRERVYLEPSSKMEEVAFSAEPKFKPKLLVTNPCHDVDRLPMYGMPEWGDAFTKRQLLTLNTLSDLLREVREKVTEDAINRGWNDDKKRLSEGGRGATAYADAIAVFLSFSIDRCADFNNSLIRWNPGNEKIMNLFARQAIPMVWDYGEGNMLENVVGGFEQIVNFQSKCIEKIVYVKGGKVFQGKAQDQSLSFGKIISTDPPYYDNIGYADLSDFFYVWMRQSLRDVFPDIFSTMSVPKSDELVAAFYRHSGKAEAEHFFMNGMKEAMSTLASNAHPSYPATIYYAFKQSDTKDKGTASTGWETFLEAVVQSGFAITGTWPLRSEQSTRMVGMGTNALASSIVLVCRKRGDDAMAIPRRQFHRELKDELPEALEAMIGGKEGASPIAPVDLAQAAIGPGMAVFSRYRGILEADGSKMSVHDALILINKTIDEYFNEAEGDMDSDTRFCIDWFMQYGFGEAEFGQANTLAQAKGTTVDGLEDAGVLEAGGGKVRLFKFSEYPDDWDPTKDNRLPVWEALHQLIRALREGGEAEAGKLLGRMADRMGSIRQLAYRLYTLCERKGWAEEARAYNELIASWHGTVSASEASRGTTVTQLTLDMSN